MTGCLTKCAPYTMASSLQPRNRLGKGGSKNDIVPTYMWKKKAGGERKDSKENKGKQE